MAKLPDPPSAGGLVALGIRREEHAIVDGVVWRIHRTEGPHVLAFDELRRFGPLPIARFDPHDEPARVQANGVLYAARDVQTCLAECFQATRVVHRRRGVPYLTAIRLERPLRLLDLHGPWPTRAGASQAISSGPRPAARAWARAIRAGFPTLDGLAYPSSMNGGGRCIAVFDPGAGALASVPELSLPLSHPGLADPLAAACQALGYRLL